MRKLFKQIAEQWKAESQGPLLLPAGGLVFTTTGYTIATGANTLAFLPSAGIPLANVNTGTITGAEVGGATSATGILTLNGTSTGGWTGRIKEGFFKSQRHRRMPEFCLNKFARMKFSRAREPVIFLPMRENL